MSCLIFLWKLSSIIFLIFQDFLIESLKEQNLFEDIYDIINVALSLFTILDE